MWVPYYLLRLGFFEKAVKVGITKERTIFAILKSVRDQFQKSQAQYVREHKSSNVY